MTSDASDQHTATGKIEGGIDAVIVGDGADALVAAAYLGRAGQRTILLQPGKGSGAQVSKAALLPDLEVVDGEHLLSILDPEVITDLDLYRHGLEFAARRLESKYFFTNGDTLQLPADLTEAVADGDVVSDQEVGGLRALIDEVFDVAEVVEPALRLKLGHAPKAQKNTVHDFFQHALAGNVGDPTSHSITKYAAASVDDILQTALPSGPLRDALYSEASFRAGAQPHEPFSFMNFIRRLCGESAGLRGAFAYPQGGAFSLIEALRRAAQSAGVEIRDHAPVKSILVEWDRVAGVELEKGGQIRAPIVMAAQEARETFLNLVGPRNLDIEFQRMVSAPKPELASAHLHLLLSGFSDDPRTVENLSKRLVVAPTEDELRKAFIDARAGKVPQQMIIECIFPALLDRAPMNDGRQIMSAMVHPVPFNEAPDEAFRDEVMRNALAQMEVMAPGIQDHVEAKAVCLPTDLAAAGGGSSAQFGARPTIFQQMARASCLAGASNIGGLFYCGPDAQIGAGLSCSAGRAAANAALALVKARRRGA